MTPLTYEESDGSVLSIYPKKNFIKRYFFTYGSVTEKEYPFYPYKGGWSEVYATSLEEAIDKHHQKHGFTKDGYGRYCASYTEENFKLTGMYIDGNNGVFAHEVIF